MNESNITLTKQFTGCATLAAIGIQMKELKLFEPIEQTVQIAQKTIKDSPTDKLYDALISLLAGAHGLVEINTRLRADGAFKLTNPLVSPLADSYTESMIVDPAQDLRRPGRNTCNQRISAAIKAAIWDQAFLGNARVFCSMGPVVAVRRRKGQLLAMIRGWGRWYPVENVRIEYAGRSLLA